MNNFEKLWSIENDLQNMKFSNGYDKFFKEEIFRFLSIAGTIHESFKDIENNINKRMMSHILFRSLFENFIKIFYIFGNEDEKEKRYTECVNGFKKEYYKLYNDKTINSVFSKELEKPISNVWKDLNCRNRRDMLAKVKNENGENLDYIYFIYRIASFDTHGNVSKTLGEDAFNKEYKFPYIEINRAIEIISEMYLDIWNNKIKK